MKKLLMRLMIIIWGLFCSESVRCECEVWVWGVSVRCECEVWGVSVRCECEVWVWGVSVRCECVSCGITKLHFLLTQFSPLKLPDVQINLYVKYVAQLMLVEDSEGQREMRVILIPNQKANRVKDLYKLMLQKIKMVRMSVRITNNNYYQS
jgi:hypothetical protein